VFQGIALVIISVGFVSCQFEYVEETYPNTSVLFIYQNYNRNLIVGEGLQFKPAVNLAGVLNNKEERRVTYEVDPSLVTPDKTLLPQAYYTLGNPSQIVIPKGEMRGFLPVVMDSAAFLADPRSLTGEFVLPLRIVSAPNVDLVLEEKNSICISLNYFGKQFGFYQYSGEYRKMIEGVIFKAGSYAYIWTENDGRRTLETLGPTKYRMVADPTNPADPMNILNAANNIIGSFSFIIDVPMNGGPVTFESDESGLPVRDGGNSFYDAANRTLHLEYEWLEDDGNIICKVEEVLVFRNRIFDDQGNGMYINQWRF
jgi:hypothetical protein